MEFCTAIGTSVTSKPLPTLGLCAYADREIGERPSRFRPTSYGLASTLWIGGSRRNRPAGGVCLATAAAQICGRGRKRAPPVAGKHGTHHRWHRNRCTGISCSQQLSCGGDAYL